MAEFSYIIRTDKGARKTGDPPSSFTPGRPGAGDGCDELRRHRGADDQSAVIGVVIGIGVRVVVGSVERTDRRWRPA